MSRPLRRVVAIVVLLAGLAACRRGGTAIDREAARALEGDWELVLRETPGLKAVGEAPRPEVRGTLAMIANRAGVRVDEFRGIPFNVGVHDLNLGALSPGLAPEGVPGVVGSVVADSALLVIGPATRTPIHLRGAYTGDSIAGQWSTAYRRSASGTSGDFFMRRR